MAKLDPKQLQSEISEQLSSKAIEKFEDNYQHDLIYIEPSAKEKAKIKEQEDL